MKNLKNFQQLNESVKTTTRKDSFKAFDEFMKAQSNVQKAIDAMNDAYRKIDSLHRKLHYEDDPAFANAIEKVFGSYDGNFKFSLREAMKYSIPQSRVDEIKALGASKKEIKIKKVPTIFEKHKDSFETAMRYVISLFEQNPRYKTIAQQPHYGIGMSYESDVRGWSSDNSNMKYRNAMYYVGLCLRDLDPKEIEKANKELERAYKINITLNPYEKTQVRFQRTA